MSRQLSSVRSIYNVGIWPRTCNKISAYDRCSVRRLLSTTSDHNSASESVKQNDFKLSRVFVCQTQYQSIMKYYVNKGDVNSVEHIMVEMDRGGIPPNLTTINMLLSAYAAKKDGLGAQIVFDEMQKIGIKSNNLSLGILMNAYANQGDFTAVDKVLHDATAAEDANIDTELLNEVMRTNVVSGNPMGAESVLEGIKEFGLEPNADTMNILIRAYAGIGDVHGATKVLVRVGSAVQTSEVNSVLDAIHKNPTNDYWDVVDTMNREFFMSDRLVPDNETYEKFLLICAKYGRSADALSWFEEFLSKGKKVTQPIFQAFRAAVNESTFLEHSPKHFYDPENLDATLVNYRQLMASTPAPEGSTGGYATALVGNMEEAYELLQSRIRNPKDSTELKMLVKKHVSLGDLVGARQAITLAATEMTYPDDETVLALMAGYASHGDFAMAENLFEDSRHHGTSSKGLSPDGDSALNLLMGYANIGDYEGIEKSLENIKAVGYIPTIECGNYVLKSVVMNKAGVTWEDFITVYQKYFHPEGLTADNETYTQLLLACMKYDHADEAITFFNDLLLTGVPLSHLLKNLFRQVVDCDEFRALHPDIPDAWITGPGAPNPRGADHLPQYHLIWGSSPKRILRSKAAARQSQIRKLPFEKVNGKDDDDVPPPKLVLYSDLDSLKAALKARDDSGIKNIGPFMMTQFIAAYSDLKDPDSAYKLLKEREEMGLSVERNVYRAMAAAFADVGDYKMTREVFDRFAATYKGQTGKEYNSYFQIIRAHCVHGDPQGALDALKWAKQQAERGTVESVHVIMVAYASLGDMNACLNAFKMFEEYRFFPSTTTINIMLSSIVYSADSPFNSRIFFQLHETHFIRGAFVEDRFTFTQVLFACQKTGDAKLAMETFDRFLTTNMRITPLMRDTLKTILGEKEFISYHSRLMSDLRDRLSSVDEDDAMHKQMSTAIPGKADAVVTLPAAQGGKRIYNHAPKIASSPPKVRKAWSPKTPA